MEDNLVTVAIHTYEKAQILKSILEVHGIEVYIHNVNQLIPGISAGVRVRIKEGDLAKALSIIEDMSSTKSLNKALDELNKQPMVLVPVDFSEYTLRTCEFGFRLAAASMAEVVMFHAYMTPSFSKMPIGEVINYENKHDEERLEQVIEKARREFDMLKAEISQKIVDGLWPDVKYRSVLREGIPEEQVLGYAERHHPLVIIMGTRGRDKKDLDLIGSVTAEIIERSHVPVFTIPENTGLENFDSICNIAYSTNFDDKDLIAFDKLLTLMKPFNFTMHFIHFDTKDDSWAEIKLSGIKEYFKKHYPAQPIEYHLLTGNDILTSYDEFVHSHHIDVISLTTHKRNLFMRLFNPSMARKMVFHTDTPMLVFHA